jgi:SNF2 family DNA or RNA helicase
LRLDEEAAKDAASLSDKEDTDFVTRLPLFPYQKVGAAFLVKIGSGLMGDDMGLGKTIQSLAVCDKVGAKKVLIFAPSAVKWQWAAEIDKFLGKSTWRNPPSVQYPYSATLPEYSEVSQTVVIEGNANERQELWHGDYRFYIANYELLLRDFADMDKREWDVIIADEATKISNHQAKQVKAIKKLRAKRRIAMTGTPVSNRANEVWSIIDFCVPGALGDYWSFLNHYCLKNQFGGIYGYQNLDELSAKLKRYMIRRMKVDVLPELPDKIVTDIPFDLTPEEKILYKRIKKEILFEVKETDIAKIQNPMTIQYTLVKLLRLRQLADSAELLGFNKMSSKLAVLKELLQESVDNDRKVLVFTQFAAMADIIAREFAEYKPLVISGKTKEDYSSVVQKFNDIEEHKILIMTSAGQFGLNVQRASVIFHYDQEWSLAKMFQREGRAHRYGQKDTVLVYNLLAKGTVDYYVKKVLHDKAVLAGKILGDESIGMEDIKEMLAYE